MWPCREKSLANAPLEDKGRLFSTRSSSGLALRHSKSFRGVMKDVWSPMSFDMAHDDDDDDKEISFSKKKSVSVHFN